MKIILKPDWDITVQIPDKRKRSKSGHFVGRESELAVLVNELLRKEQGAILVTGYRGVGKTSFAYQALNKVLEDLDHKKVLLVLVNIKQLDRLDRQSVIDPKSILINFIRRLYSVSQEEDLKSSIKGDIETLYKKAVSSEYKSVEAFESEDKSLRETERSREIEFNAQQLNIAQIAWAICFTIALTFQFFPVFGDIQWVSKIVPLIFAFPVPFIFSLVWRNKRIFSVSSSKSNSAKQLYTIDNSVENLEFDLEKIHRDLRESGVKTIYLLDELDKLEPEYVVQSLKYYKNLFTLSSAMFVFIGDEDLFKSHHMEVSLNEGMDNSYRSLEYTLFTSKYFLSRPTDKDLFVFLDEIIENTKDLKNENGFENFKRLLVLEAKCDYFDLLQVIKGRINGFDKLNPILEIPLDTEIAVSAKIQKAVSVLYNEKYIAYNPSKWIENESVLRALYNHAALLIQTPLGSEVNDPDPERKRHLTLLQNLALYDFHAFLFRLGYLGLTNYSREIVTSTNDQGNNIYRTINSKKYHLIGEVSGDVPDKINFLSQLEERLVNEIDLLYQIMMNCWNIYAAIQKIPGTKISQFRQNTLFYTHKMKQWGVNIKGTITELEQVYRTLTESYPAESYKREDTEKNLKQVTEVVARIQNAAHEVLARVIQDAYSNRNYQILDLAPRSEIFSGDSNIETFRQGILSRNIPHKLLTNSNFSQQVLFCQKIDEKALSDLKQIQNEYFGRKWVVMVETNEGEIEKIKKLLPGIEGLKLIVLSIHGDTEVLQKKVFDLFESKLKG